MRTGGEVGMTNKEAIEIISRYEVNGCGYCHQGGDEIPEAFNMAINALKAQEPMKPNKVQGRWFKAYHCSACGKIIVEVGGNKVNFCYHCGQAVKWE
jgi:DNA-directed RNA polymerase subunit RPC12/RpoP